MRKKCLDCVYELAGRDNRVVFIGSDLGIGTMVAHLIGWRLIPLQFNQQRTESDFQIGRASCRERVLVTV